jgi:hypothetical protein
MPSLGAATLPTAPPPVPPAGGGGGGGGGGGPAGGAAAKPVATLPARIRARALRRGVAVRVKVAAGGAVGAVGRVGGKVVARGKTRAKRAGTVTLRLKATRKRPARLRGKTLVIRVTAGGATTTVKRKLR